MRAVKKLVERIAATDAFVLVTGESGVGKDVVARTVHALSSRSRQPLHHVWCGQPAEGADAGVFEAPRGLLALRAASRPPGATVYLDEVGDLSLTNQARVLAVIEAQEQPDHRGARIRIIATTKHDLMARVRQGAFREELFYRLDVLTVQVPPLRQRREDIDDLVAALIRRHRGSASTPPRDGLSPALMARLREHAWPGNVRELENMVRRLLVAGEAEVIRALDDAREMTVAVAPAAVVENRANGAPAPAAPPAKMSGGLRELTRRAALDIEAQTLRQILDQVHWNRVHAARVLQISYKTLLAKIKQHKLA
jgi:DNA-binding NtrC family response regulator